MTPTTNYEVLFLFLFQVQKHQTRFKIGKTQKQLSKQRKKEQKETFKQKQ
jgi:hypothetical protein